MPSSSPFAAVGTPQRALTKQPTLGVDDVRGLEPGAAEPVRHLSLELHDVSRSQDPVVVTQHEPHMPGEEVDPLVAALRVSGFRNHQKEWRVSTRNLTAAIAGRVAYIEGLR
jgi:hypothetical protein